MLQSRPNGGRVARGRAASLATAASMAAFALTGRAAAFTATAPTTSISMRGFMSAASSPMSARARAQHVLARTAVVPLGASFDKSSCTWIPSRSCRGERSEGAGAMTVSSRCSGIGRGWGYAAYSPYNQFAGAVAMCSSAAQAAAVGGGIEVSADVAALDGQIKVKGETIRELKAGGAAKDALKPHIEELLELKQLYAKAAGEAYGPPQSKDKGKGNGEGKQGGKGQEKQMDTKKATKEAKRLAMMESDKAKDPMEGLEYVMYPSKDQLLAGQAQEPEQRMGDYVMMKSQHETGRVFSPIADLGVEGGVAPGSQVWVRGRVHQVRGKGGSAFMVLRQDGAYTVQALHFKDKENPDVSKRLIKYMASLPLESVADVKGTLVEATVKSCSQSTVEIKVERVHCVSRSSTIIPFSVEDASRGEAEVEASQDTERPLLRLGQDIRLDNRWMDLRTPANNAIMRVQSAVCQLFRESLYSQGFMEIHTPKIIPGESEGGAGVFTTDYFGRQACLAQSPQLYKQMAISGDLKRVFEVGPVFRAENSNTRRHLCEFMGLDLEMSITDHYNEVISVLHNTFKHIFNGLEERFKAELDAIRTQYPSESVTFSEEPLIVHWEDGIKMLRDAGHEADDFEDLSGAQELALGGLVKEKFDSDFFFLDRFPAQIRPFYTMPCPDDARYSNSYDLILRGQEICSGAQRCHDADMLVEILKEKGVPPEPLADYINAFRHGCPPHGGGGVGLERIVFLYLGLDNIRKASMFPRDPNRCTP